MHRTAPHRTTSQGLELRELKKSKPDKATLQPHIDTLIALKAQYKEKTGKDYVPVPVAAPANKAAGGGGTAAAATPAAEAESPAAAAITAKIVAKVWVAPVKC